MSTDERKSLPSASGIERIAACAGSWHAELNAPREEPSEDAERGTRIHEVLAGEAPRDSLNTEEQEMVMRCEALTMIVAEKAYGNIEHADEVTREQRLWLKDADGRPVVSGKFDLIARFGMRYLVIDYKTGRGGVTDAVTNLQLRTAVAILSSNAIVHEAIVAIVQPDSDDGYTIARYDDNDIAAARYEVESIIAQATPTARRTPSENACKYCKAKAICPEAREAALETPLPIVEFIQPEELAAALTEEKLAAFLERGSLVEKVVEACRDEAKRRLHNGIPVGNWTLKAGTFRDTVVDPQTVFNRFSQLGGSVEHFMACVGLTKGKLKDAVKTVTAKKGKALDIEVEGLLSGCVESKQSAPSLSLQK